MAPVDQDAPGESFAVKRSAKEALGAATTYLQAAGQVAPPLAGRIDGDGDSLVIHHGRIKTRIEAVPQGDTTLVHVTRIGRAPLESSRRSLYLLGLAGTIFAWALAVYNARSEQFLSPLVTMAFFFTGLLAVVVALYVVDRSVERRVDSLLRGIAAAVEGKPLDVLDDEIAALDRKTAIVNALLFFCAGIVATFLIFVILDLDGVRQNIDHELALQLMRVGMLFPIIPAIIFGAIYYAGARRLHRTRLAAL